MAKQDFQFRAAKREDIPFLTDLRKKYFPPFSPTLLSQEVSKKPDGFLMVENSLGAVGYAQFYFVAGEIHLLELAVDEKHLRSGLGRAMLQELENKKPKRIFLEVRVSNEAALSFYRQLNFEVVGRRPAYYYDKEDAFLMTKKFD